MQIIVTLAVLLSSASYVGMFADAPAFAGVPFSLLAGAIVTFAMLYVLAKA